MTAAPATRATRARRLLAFALESHPPATYVLVAGGWAGSVLSLLQLARGQGHVQLDLGSLGIALTFFLILLFLRAVDEIKDLDYDREHNPDRPLARGAVSIGEVAGFAVGVYAVVLMLSAALAPMLMACAAVQMLYGVLLLQMERLWARFRSNIVLNLLLTFPVSAVLNVEAWLYLAHRDLAPSWSQALPVMLAQVAMFLHMEFGRKLKWPQLSQPGENGYAQALGVPLTVLICAGLGIGAVLLAWQQLAASGKGALALLPASALLLSAYGFLRFYRIRDRVVSLKPWFGGAMIVYFLVNTVVALSH